MLRPMSALAGTLEDALEKVKPRLRGTFHTFGFVASLFGIAELALSPTDGWRYVAGILYGCSLTLMLGLSALYHRPMWSHAARNRLRMADHIGIYFLISGTYTPFAALISAHAPTVGLIGMWVGAVAGIIYALVHSHGPRMLRAGLYVVLGLCSAPMILGLPTTIGWNLVSLLLIGATSTSWARSSTRSAGPTRGRASSATTRCFTSWCSSPPAFTTPRCGTFSNADLLFSLSPFRGEGRGEGRRGRVPPHGETLRVL
jgi:hemolysin III